MEDLWLRQSFHGWVLFLGIKSVYSDKSERNYRGKCLGWPVTSYSGEIDSLAGTLIFILSFFLNQFLTNKFCIGVLKQHEQRRGIIQIQ